MAETVDLEVVAGLGDIELIEEDVRHQRIEVLPRMSDDLGHAGLRDRAADGSGFDELGPSAQDGKNLNHDRSDAGQPTSAPDCWLANRRWPPTKQFRDGGRGGLLQQVYGALMQHGMQMGFSA
ncbi:hypothetical protein OCUBac02_42540 [Bosea sp. ANAM02]|nr:hypothetical protein OCUBac02_42540 [Bosea sp. ANAM02]